MSCQQEDIEYTFDKFWALYQKDDVWSTQKGIYAETVTFGTSFLKDISPIFFAAHQSRVSE